MDPHFTGTLSLSNGKPGTLVVDHEFHFYDSEGTDWVVHQGDITNGASIPKILKPIVGQSFQETYLPASVLHDVYCVSRTRTWQKTARMFYQAMTTNGVPWYKAYPMYLAVISFGPHWVHP